MARLAEIMRDDAQQAERAQQDVTAARALLKKGSLAKWQAIVSELDTKRRTTVEARTAAEALYKVACRNAAMGKTDANQKQRDALVILNAAKADAELALGALVAAEAERDQAARADAIVRADDYQISRRKALAEAKATAREALAKHSANVAALQVSDRELKDALSCVNSYLPHEPDSRTTLDDLDHACGVLYAFTIPQAWRPGEYDLIRKSVQGDPNSMVESRPAPTWYETFGGYLSE